MNGIELPSLFETCFRAWTERIRKALPESVEIIAVDVNAAVVPKMV